MPPGNFLAVCGRCHAVGTELRPRRGETPYECVDRVACDARRLTQPQPSLRERVAREIRSLKL